MRIARRLSRDSRIVIGTRSGWDASSGVESGKIDEGRRFGLWDNGFA
jgi:hypothetical protein